MTLINSYVGVQKRNGSVYYFNGCFPFYSHSESNRDSFKNIVCQLICNGRATRSEISKAFQIPSRSISRWMAMYEKEGDGCFFRKKKRRDFASSPPKQ
jgi:hypothetical protein